MSTPASEPFTYDWPEPTDEELDALEHELFDQGDEFEYYWDEDLGDPMGYKFEDEDYYEPEDSDF